MPKDMFTEVRDIFFDLAKYVFEHPTDQGRALLDRYEKTLLNNDVLITSKRDIKNKLVVTPVCEDEYTKELEIDLCLRRRCNKFYYTNEPEVFEDFMKNDFVAYLERGMINDKS